MNEQEIMDKLRDAVESAGSQSKFAEQVGVSQPFVSDVLNGNRKPSERMLAAIGLRRAVLPLGGAA